MLLCRAPIDKITKALGQDERRCAHLDHPYLSSCDQKIKSASADAGEPAGVRNTHADGFDRKRR